MDRQPNLPFKSERVHKHWNEVSKQQEYFEIDPEEIGGEVWTWEEYQRQLATTATQRFREFRVIREIYSHALPELCSFSCKAGK